MLSRKAKAGGAAFGLFWLACFFGGVAFWGLVAWALWTYIHSH